MLWVCIAWSAPTVVAAVGEPWQIAATPPMPGWSSALADCLEERAPGNYAVLDRTVLNATPRTLPADFSADQPSILVIGVHAPTSQLDQELAAWRAFVDENKRHKVLLIGPVSPPPPPSVTPAHSVSDEGALALGLTQMAASLSRVVHLDLQRQWDPAQRANLYGAGGLTLRGHALLAALLCDEILRWSPQ